MNTNVKKYLSYFRIRFINGLQYRVAAYAGIATQFAWGFMEILMFGAFYHSNPSGIPMGSDQLATYLWLRQAFLGLFMTWYFDADIMNMINNGDVAYELCRPADLYNMWFAKNSATRVSRAALRCLPILLVAGFLPEQIRMRPPQSPEAAALFSVSLVMGFFLTVAVSMLAYIMMFYTVSGLGVKIIISNIVDFFSGSLIPLAFFPDGIRPLLEMTPFASTLNTPFMIYCGATEGAAAYKAMLTQAVWLIVITAAGKLWMNKALKRVVVQGG